jgi:hypothetical protein
VQRRRDRARSHHSGRDRSARVNGAQSSAASASSAVSSGDRASITAAPDSVRIDVAAARRIIGARSAFADERAERTSADRPSLE